MDNDARAPIPRPCQAPSTAILANTATGMGSGMFPSKPAGRVVHRGRAGSQRIVSNHSLCLANDVGARRAAHLVGSPGVVRRQRAYFSHGADVCNVRRSRALGAVGASSRATNSAYALGLSTQRVRSIRASSAALRAASSTKSVRFFPGHTRGAVNKATSLQLSRPQLKRLKERLRSDLRPHHASHKVAGLEMDSAESP